MSKKSLIVIPIALFMVIILLQSAYSGFRLGLENPSEPTVIDNWTPCTICGIVQSSFYGPCDYRLLSQVCCQCHANKPPPKVKISTKESANRHLKKRWPKNEYRLAEGQRVRFINTNAYVIKRKGRLVLYENKRALTLPERAKIIKAGNSFFILE